MEIDKQAFFEKYAPIAIQQQIKYGIPASITLAQMAWESSYGTGKPALYSNNFFLVKKISFHTNETNDKEHGLSTLHIRG